MGADAEIRPLDGGSAEQLLIRDAGDGAALDGCYLRRAVLPALFLRGFAVLLDDLAVAQPANQVVIHRGEVEVETVSTKASALRIMRSLEAAHILRVCTGWLLPGYSPRSMREAGML